MLGIKTFTFSQVRSILQTANNEDSLFRDRRAYTVVIDDNDYDFDPVPLSKDIDKIFGVSVNKFKLFTILYFGTFHIARCYHIVSKASLQFLKNVQLNRKGQNFELEMIIPLWTYRNNKRLKIKMIRVRTQVIKLRISARKEEIAFINEYSEVGEYQGGNPLFMGKILDSLTGDSMSNSTKEMFFEISNNLAEEFDLTRTEKLILYGTFNNDYREVAAMMGIHLQNLRSKSKKLRDRLTPFFYGAPDFKEIKDFCNSFKAN